MAALELYLTEVPRLRGREVDTRAFASDSPEWWSHAIGRLGQLTRLRAGWDGARGKAVSPHVARFAQTLLEGVGNVRKPQLVPLSDGGLQIEWHANGMSIEIAISSPPAALLLVEYQADDEIVEREIRGIDAGLLADLEKVSA